jgi:hypothetical protein
MKKGNGMIFFSFTMVDSCTEKEEEENVRALILHQYIATVKTRRQCEKVNIAHDQFYFFYSTYFFVV